MSEKDVYTDLAMKIGAPVSRRFLAILDTMFTPQEVKILLELYIPATQREVAESMGVEEQSLSKPLESLVDRGIITRGKTQFAFHTTLLGFHHDLADTGVHSGPQAMSQQVKDLWADFFFNEWSDIWVKMASDRKKAGIRGNIITPAIGALELSPNIKPEQILLQENWKAQIQNAKRRIVAPCGCRTLWGKCDHPTMTCFAAFDNSRGEYYLNKPGRLLKEVSLSETVQIVRSNEEAGLVHWGVCYCCSDACEMLYSYDKADRMDLVDANRFIASVNEDLCKGCQDCVEKCQFRAIEMRKSAGSKKLKAHIIDENCKGCGVCIVGCKQKAMRYELVRPAEYITSRPPITSNPQPVDLKTTRKILVGAYGGFYQLD